MRFPYFRKSIEANKLKTVPASPHFLRQSYFLREKTNSKEMEFRICWKLLRKINRIRHGWFYPNIECASSTVRFISNGSMGQIATVGNTICSLWTSISKPKLTNLITHFMTLIVCTFFSHFHFIYFFLNSLKFHCYISPSNSTLLHIVWPCLVEHTRLNTRLWVFRFDSLKKGEIMCIAIHSINYIVF